MEITTYCGFLEKLSLLVTGNKIWNMEHRNMNIWKREIRKSPNAVVCWKNFHYLSQVTKYGIWNIEIWTYGKEKYGNHFILWFAGKGSITCHRWQNMEIWNIEIWNFGIKKYRNHHILWFAGKGNMKHRNMKFWKREIWKSPYWGLLEKLPLLVTGNKIWKYEI